MSVIIYLYNFLHNLKVRFVTYNNIHVIKYTFSLLIGIFFVKTFFSGRDYAIWIIITTCIIMGPDQILGFHIKKSLLRILGTLFGALIGLVIFISSASEFTNLIFTIAMALTIAKLSTNYKQFNYAFNLSMITFIIVVYGSHPSIAIALFRVSFIISGILIALLVSKFIIPIDSKKSILFKLSNNIEYMTLLTRKIFFRQEIIKNSNRIDSKELVNLEYKLSNGIHDLLSMLSYIQYEKILNKKIKPYSQLLIQNYRSISRYLFTIRALLNKIIVNKDINKILLTLANDFIQILEKFHCIQSITIASDYKREIKFNLNNLELLIKEFPDIERKKEFYILLFALQSMFTHLYKTISVWNKLVNSNNIIKN